MGIRSINAFILNFIRNSSGRCENKKNENEKGEMIVYVLHILIYFTAGTFLYMCILFYLLGYNFLHGIFTLTHMHLEKYHISKVVIKFAILYVSHRVFVWLLTLSVDSVAHSLEDWVTNWNYLKFLGSAYIWHLERRSIISFRLF